jgi:D-alanyl-lipoteichoic acid acyltransferase DltB (MBOAT superfamily)
VIDIAPYSGLSFWILMAIFVVGHLLFRRYSHSPTARNLYMISMSIVIIELIQNEPNYLIFLLLLLIGIVYASGKMLLNKKSARNRKQISMASIGIILFLLCYFKFYDFRILIDHILDRIGASLCQGKPSGGRYIIFLGVSYFSFKFVHFLAECYKKKIKKIDLLTFANYILFFPSFFAGPINRFNQFYENIYFQSTVYPNWIVGIKRIINGLFKKVVLAGWFLPKAITSLDLATATPWNAVLGIYAYMFFVYFDFSGLSDMAIGSGKLVGIDLPENFNNPFLKRNLQQFWANWHMSLTNWLTDYIYWPLAKKIRHAKMLEKKPITISNICIIITFMVCGVWHGEGIHFLVWGTYNGIGLAILNIYTSMIREKASRKVQMFIKQSKISYAASNMVTFQFVAFGFLLFACDYSQLLDLYSLLVR